MSRRLPRGKWLALLCLVPFALFFTAFQITPLLWVAVHSLITADGWGLGNFSKLFASRFYLQAVQHSLEIAFYSSVLGLLIALFGSYSLRQIDSRLRDLVMAFANMSSNFAGVPLAFAFIATLGRVGLVTMLLKQWFGINIYAMGFNLLSFWGLTLTYLFFQIPLMILIITPALEGLKREWREAAEVLGASTGQYWRMVALPILFPSLLGTFALLFANSFGAVATAYALTGSSLSIVPIMLFAQIRGDVLQDPHLGYAMAFGMIVVTGLANLAYVIMRTRAERWMR